jgi:ketosteroid isomerase-like protein
MSGDDQRELVAGFYENVNSGDVSYARCARAHRESGEAGDMVIVEGRFVVTHKGPLATPDDDVEGAGASVDLRFADCSRMRVGKIVSYRTYYDQFGMPNQLGVMSS